MRAAAAKTGRSGSKIIPCPDIARPGRSPRSRKPRCRVASTRGGLAMPIHLPTVVATHPRVAELDRLGDEIAELSAHLDAATPRLLDLIRAFDAPGGWNTGFPSCA